MSDIKLFRVGPKGVAEIPGQSAQVEKSLQTLFEDNLEALLGVRKLAHEHYTGKVHGGRIDTLGIDENNCPVIIEYKRSVNENVINQALYYLDWLMDHQGEFELLVMHSKFADSFKAIEWSGPRLLCIAGDFTKYDVHAVKQNNCNIELLRYRRYGDDLLLLERINAASASPTTKPVSNGAGVAIKDLFEALKSYLLELGDDVEMKELKRYIAFKRIKNFACVEIQLQKVLVFLKVDPTRIKLNEGFSKDMTGIGHYGTGDLEITLRTMDDLTLAQPLLVRSYQES
jgi:predicted transport protein